MAEYRVTFGQRYRREAHPHYAGAHPDGWLTVKALDEEEARGITVRFLGEHWSGLYRADDPHAVWWMYPMGELAVLERD